MPGVPLASKPTRKTRISPTELPELDIRKIVTLVCNKFNLRKDGQLINFLATLEIEGQKFKYIYNDQSFIKIFFKCPRCKSPRAKLFRVDDRYACRDCHFICKKRLRRTHRQSAIYTRYLRPLQKLAELERKIFSDSITLRQRQIYEKQAGRLIKAIPDYIMAMREQILESIEKLEQSDD